MAPRRRVAPPRWASLLLLFCCAAFCSCQDGGTALQPRVETDTLLVALVDGSLAALDARSGAFLWRFATREPLLSSSLTWTRGAAGDGGGDATTAVFPGADGSLFAYQLATGTVEKLPLSAVDLVAASPSVSNDGAVVVGSRTSSAFALDPVTGAVLHAFTPTTGGGGDTEHADDLGDVDVLLEGSPLGGKLAAALLVGKTQYTVRSVDAVTGMERWNVTYSELRPLRLSPPRGGEGKALPGGGFLGSEAAPTLVPGTDASLRSLGPDGWERWAVQLGYPPVALFRSSGPHSFEAVPLDSGSHRAASGGSSTVAVGMHAHGLFALPPPALTTEPRSRRDTTPALAPSRGVVTEVVTTGMAGHGLRSEAHGLVPVAAPQEQVPAAMQLQLVAVADPGPKDYDWLPSLSPASRGQIAPSKAIAGRQPASVAASAGTVLAAVLAAGVGGALVMRASIAARGRGAVLDASTAAGNVQLAAVQQQAEGVSSPTPKQRRNRNKRKGKGKPVSNEREEEDSASDGGAEGDAEPEGAEPRSGGGADASKSDSAGGEADPAAAAAVPPTPTLPPPSAQRLPSGALRVGRLHVGPGVLGYGSCGTVVFEGSLDGRQVAVKRLLLHFHELAKKELDALIRSDEHPSVLRCFAMEEDQHFVYVALERCVCTLADLLEASSGSTAPGDSLATPPPGDEGDTSPVSAAAHSGVLLRKELPVMTLFEADGSPTPTHWALMRDISSGLAALHHKGIIHRDVKPHNVLITKAGRAKLSDMGLSRALQPGEASSMHGTLSSGVVAGAGTLGWRAPERLHPNGRQGRGVDVWALGCVLFYCLSGGHHPYGDAPLSRDAAVASGRAPDLNRLAPWPEAQDLVKQLLAHDPAARPSAGRVLTHPFWWPPDMRLAFLVDASDRVELEDREHNSKLLAALEGVPSAAMHFPWDARLHAGLLDNLGRYRRYNPFSVRDLLRVIRNKRAHWRELPAEVRSVVGPPPGPFWAYWSDRFPQLLLYVHRFVGKHCAGEPHFGRYFPPDDIAAIEAFSRIAPSSTEPEEQAGDEQPHGAGAEQRGGVAFPERPGVQDCTYYLKTGRCKFGDRCIFNHPRVVPEWKGQAA